LFLIGISISYRWGLLRTMWQTVDGDDGDHSDGGDEDMDGHDL
jgi:hypothetical protein